MHAVEFRHVKKTFKHFILDDLSFTIPTGVVTGLIGQNGAGKSTIIQLLLTLIKKQQGEIFIFNADQQHDPAAWKAKVGVVLDELHIPDHLTAIEIEKLYAAVYTTWDRDYYFSLLDRLDVKKYDKIKALSKGTKMKLALALALSYHPQLLILDEPTNGLDPVVREDVLTLLAEFMEQDERTIFFSSHITSDLEKLADHLLFIHKGALLLEGDKDELLYTYALWQGSMEEMLLLPKEGIIGSRTHAFGKELLVRRDTIRDASRLQRPTIDDLLYFFVKGRF